MFALHFLLIIGHAFLAATVQVARVLPRPVGDASHKFRHDSYIDSKVRQVAVNILNHQAYHQRNVVFPSSASIFPSFASNLTNATSLLLDTEIQLQPSPTIPPPTPLQSVMSTTLGGLCLSSVTSSLTPHQTLYNGSCNISIALSSMGRKSSAAQISSSLTISQLIGFLPIGSVIKGGSLGPTFGVSASLNSTAKNRFSIRPTGSVLATSVGRSGGAQNVTHSGSAGCIHTVTLYNLTVTTVTAPSIPAPVILSGPSRYAIANSLHLKTDLARAANASLPWKEATDDACTSHLGTLNGVATNPSGISPCYNVRTLNDSTGAFNAELRLYRVTSATEDWTQLRSDGVTVGMAYLDATVTLQGIVEKRGFVELQEPVGHTIISRLFTRATAAPPKLLQTLSFQGQVHNKSVPELSVNANTLALLTPKINLAGVARSGTSISTQLSLQDASFVNGIFANRPPNVTQASMMIIGSREWLSKANSFSSFPLSLLFVAVWSAMLLSLEGYDVLEKLKCRNEDRKRLLAASGGGGVGCAG